MRGRVGASLVVMVVLLLAVPTQAHASCPRSGGTVPGSPPTAYAVSAGGETLYIDDRGAIGPDAGGLWVYRESNGAPGLQRGGYHIVRVHVPVGPIGPIRVLPDDENRPVLRRGLTLFPNGSACYWSCLNPLPGDDCHDGAHPPDTLLL